jgi:CheY-specific phosphatase CheX
MQTDDASTNDLTQLIRDSSLSRMQQLSKRKNIQIGEISKDPLVFAHWMSFILLSGKDLRILFKAHYMSHSAKFFAEKAFASEKETVTKLRVLDFFKEFCNLTAGNIKIALASNKVKVGISLPILARGFDEIFYPRPADSIMKCWSLECEDEIIFCSVHIAILQPISVKYEATGTSINEGEVEFL